MPGKIFYTGGGGFSQTVGQRLVKVGDLPPQPRQPDVRSQLFTPVVSVIGTLYFQACAGAITVTGLVTKLVRKSPLGGSITASGALAARTALSKLLSGSITMTGGIRRKTARRLTGSITATGAATKRTFKRMTGAITVSGSVARKVSKKMLGSITATASLSKRLVLTKLLSGSLTPSGSLTWTFLPGAGITSFVGSTITFLRRFLGRR